MKKTIVALAALTAVGGVFAQSSVSITGLVGAAYQSVDNSAGTGSAARGLTLTNADIKLTAVEDLGGGLKAIASVVLKHLPCLRVLRLGCPLPAGLVRD
ncbi:MAG: porin [Rhodoferax sp.]|nr:porin [Rhodoferax sp.]